MAADCWKSADFELELLSRVLTPQTLEKLIAEYEELLGFFQGMRTLFMRTRRQEVVSILQGFRERSRGWHYPVW
jgi:hypothetical protein